MRIPSCTMKHHHYYKPSRHVNKRRERNLKISVCKCIEARLKSGKLQRITKTNPFWTSISLEDFFPLVRTLPYHQSYPFYLQISFVFSTYLTGFITNYLSNGVFWDINSKMGIITLFILLPDHYCSLCRCC